MNEVKPHFQGKPFLTAEPGDSGGKTDSPPWERRVLLRGGWLFLAQSRGLLLQESRANPLMQKSFSGGELKRRK